MALTKEERRKLQVFVGLAKRLLSRHFQEQMQKRYGMDPETGIIIPQEQLRDLSAGQLELARLLRDIWQHYEGNTDFNTSKEALNRIVREQTQTFLLRICTLRMAEARSILRECISAGNESNDFTTFNMLASGALGSTNEAYALYLNCLFEELAVELPDAFDPNSPFGLLFPDANALNELLSLINDEQLEGFWSEDETIGWIYQYFNTTEERDALRGQKIKIPRNSHELAVRNQFFTPRYVVEFLLDNSLGRLWINATGGNTRLSEDCRFSTLRSDEITANTGTLRDPRTLKILDPACGSMHFGLYAFNLLQTIYEEAWDWEENHGEQSLVDEHGVKTAVSLHKNYVDKDFFLLDIPRLIVEQNIYGVDIDPRAVQIAQTALWLRAQKAWQEKGVESSNRPTIKNNHIIAATAPPPEKDILKSVKGTLTKADAALLENTLSMLSMVPETGILLRLEQSIETVCFETMKHTNDDLFESGWKISRNRLEQALKAYAQSNQATFRDRLFGRDIHNCLSLIELCCEKFDVLVMNPPFGSTSKNTKDFLGKNYPAGKTDILQMFVLRGIELLRRKGIIGCISSRSVFFGASSSKWRKQLLELSKVIIFADLGLGVMDDALVEAAAYILEKK